LNCSLSDRKPVDTDDEVVVMIIPDHQMLESVERISSQLSDDPVCNLCLTNFSMPTGTHALVYILRKMNSISYFPSKVGRIGPTCAPTEHLVMHV
jgi:hypothetical protein